MIEPRLASELRINALRKYMSQNGEFVTILHKGDAISGAILCVVAIRGVEVGLYEKRPGFAVNEAGVDKVVWDNLINQDIEIKQKIDETINKRLRFDPDLWVIELDIADIAQLDAIWQLMG